MAALRITEWHELKRSRRGPLARWLVVGVALVAIVVLISLGREDGLTQGTFQSFPGAAFPSDTDAIRYTYVAGREFTFAITVRNDGRRPITVTGLSAPAAPGVVERVGVRVSGATAPTPDDEVWERATAFKAFPLRPKEERLILIRSRFAVCQPPPHQVFDVSFSDVPVHYWTVPLVRRVTHIPFPMPLVVGPADSQPGCG